MFKKILFLIFACINFSCFSMQDTIDQQKLALIEQKGMRWYLIFQISWQEENKQKNFPLTLCDLIAEYADNQQPLTDAMKRWLFTKIKIPYKAFKTGWMRTIACNPHQPNEFISGHSENEINIYDLQSCKKTTKLKSQNNCVNALAFNPHKPNEAASGSDDGKIYLWNIETGLWNIKKIKQNKVLTSHEGPVRAVIFNPHKSDELASGSTDGTVCIWNTQTGKIIKLIFHKPYGVTAAVYNPHRFHELIYGLDNGEVYIRNMQSDQEIKKLSYPDSYPISMTFDPQKVNEVIIGMDTGDIHIKNIKTNKEELTLTGHTQWVRAVEFNPFNSSELVSFSEDKTIRTWDLSHFKGIQRICVNPSVEEAKRVVKMFQTAQEKEKSC